MKRIIRFYREFVWRHWRVLLVALALTATLNQAGFAFSMLGMWLVDDVLQVGQTRATAEVAADAATGADAELPAPAPEAETTTPDTAETDEERARKMRGLKLFLAISIGLHFTTAVLGGAAGYIKESTGQRVLFRLRMALKRRLTGLSASYYSRQQTGQLMVRVLDDANAVQANTVNLPVNFLTYLFTLGMGLFLLARLNPSMTLVALCILPLYATGSLLFMGALRRNTEHIRTANADLQAVLEEDLSLIGTIKSYAREPAEDHRFFRQLRHNLALAWRQNKLNTALSVTLMVISGIGTTGILLYGFLQIRSGDMQIGAVLAFYGMTGLLFSPLTSLTNMSVVVQTTQVLLKRVYDVLDAQPDVKEPVNPAQIGHLRGEIRFDNVSLHYGEGPVAVDRMSFHIPAGERAAFLGTSGSGRTTVAHLLLRFYDPVSGTVSIDGIDLRRFPLSRLRASIGLAAQEQRLFSGTVRDNIAFGAQDGADDGLIENAARMAGVHDAILNLPHGYHTKVGKGGVSLDGSVVQRIAVARVLIGDPAILIFDDSVSTLSDDEESSLYRSVKDIFGDRTQILITNRVKTAMTTDRIFVLRSGRLIEHGTHDELIAAKGAYWRMYLHQTRRPEDFPREKVRPHPVVFQDTGNPPEQSL